MKAFAVTNPGLEEYSAQEVEDLIKVKARTEKSIVLFEASEEKLAYLCYRGQSFIKVCTLFEKIKLSSLDDMKEVKTNFTKIIPKGKTFRVKFARQGKVELSSQEVEPALGEIIFNQFKGKIKVSMDNPDYIVYIYCFDNDAYIGIDYAGFDLSKRDYRVFANPKSFHANIAYSLLRIAGLKDKDVLVDPFCLSGEIGIEAALFLSRKSPHFYSKQKFAFNKFMKFNFEKVDKEIRKSKGRIVLASPAMNDVRAAQKNSKIASVEKSIEFTRQDIEWIDFKFKKKESVDKIVTQMQCPSSNVPEHLLKKTYEDFFFQIKYLLNKKGRVVVMGKNLDYFKKVAKGVKLLKEIKFKNGQEEMEIAVFTK